MTDARDPGTIERLLLEEIAALTGKNASDIDSDTSLQDLGINSLGLVEILVFVEKTFDLDLLGSGLTRENLRTPRILAAHIARLE